MSDFVSFDALRDIKRLAHEGMFDGWSPTVMYVLYVYASEARGDHQRLWLAHSEAAKLTGLGLTAIKESLRKLEQEGILVPENGKQSRSKCGSIVYRLSLPEPTVATPDEPKANSQKKKDEEWEDDFY